MSTLGAFPADLPGTPQLPPPDILGVHIRQLELLLQGQSGHHDIPQRGDAAVLRCFINFADIFSNKREKAGIRLVGYSKIRQIDKIMIDLIFNYHA